MFSTRGWGGPGGTGANRDGRDGTDGEGGAKPPQNIKGESDVFCHGLQLRSYDDSREEEQQITEEEEDHDNDDDDDSNNNDYDQNYSNYCFNVIVERFEAARSAAEESSVYIYIHIYM